MNKSNHKKKVQYNQNRNQIQKKQKNNVNNAELKHRIQSQNPATRRKNRVKIDPKHMEIVRRKQELKKLYIKKQRESAVRTMIVRLILFLFIFILIFAFAVGMFFMNLFKSKNVNYNNNDYIYQIGADDAPDKLIRHVKLREVTIDGEIYIDMNELAKLYNCTVTGNISELKYIFPESEDNVKFIIGSNLAYLNGVPTRLSYSIYDYNNTIYVPFEFFQDYVNGMQCVYDAEKRKIVLSRVKSGVDADNNPVYEPITLTIKQCSSLANIVEASLDYDLKLLTEPRPTVPIIDETIPGEVDVNKGDVVEN